MSRSQQVQEFCTVWDSKVGLRWKIEESKVPLWKHKDSNMTTWKLRVRSHSMECMTKILVDQIKITLDSLATYVTLES
jgi:hypothetical protein